MAVAKRKKKRIARRKRKAPPTRSILDRARPLTEIESNIVMLVYGRSGSGKTHFASTFPTPSLLIDCNEGGTDTIADRHDIEHVLITNWDEFDDLYWELAAGTDYESIIIDQITALQDFAMNDVRLKAKKGPADVFSTRNWGQMSGLFKTGLEHMRDLKRLYNLCFIAHERIFDSDTDEEADVIAPNISARVIPSVVTFIEGAVDAIGGTFIRERFVGEGDEERPVAEYCMRIGPQQYYATKIRRPASAGALPDVIVDPTFQKIKDLTSGIKPKRKGRRKV
jgi:hypothetical protein